MRSDLCVVLHDVAPATWPQCEQILAMLDANGAPRLTLLVVPDFHGSGRIDMATGFVRAIEQRIARGDEIALHGYDHLDHAPAPRHPLAWMQRRVLTAGEGEFSTLTREEAAARIDAGLEVIRSLGWPVRGFVAPAWLASAGTRTALRESGLQYSSSHRALLTLPGTRVSAPCLTASPRARWRRQMSRAWLAAGARLYANAPLIRIGIHPADALHTDLMDTWTRLLQQLLSEREAFTKSEALQRARQAQPLPA